MRSGKLNKRVTIQAPSQSQDSYGQPVDTWTTFAEVWAGISPVRGQENAGPPQRRAEVTHEIRIRYLPGVLPTMRVLYATRVFEIACALDFGEKHRELVLQAVEVQ